MKLCFLATTTEKIPPVASTFVLDTCVLLADPNSLVRFDEHDVVLPLVVVEELDRKKTRMDEVGANARGAIRLLEELGASATGGMREPVQLPGGAPSASSSTGSTPTCSRRSSTRLHRTTGSSRPV
jgi:predicted ribonuclease YlaK